MPFSLVTEDVLKEKDKMLAHFRESGSYSYPPLKEYRSENLLKERKGLMFAILIAETKEGERVVFIQYSYKVSYFALYLAVYGFAVFVKRIAVSRKFRHGELFKREDIQSDIIFNEQEYTLELRESYRSYCWFIDGKQIPDSDIRCITLPSSVESGIHEALVIVTTNDGTILSTRTEFTIPQEEQP